MRILIVEDEPLIARRLQQLCRDILGDRLEIATVSGSFDAASARLRETPFDVMLLDLNLHNRDGLDLLATASAQSFHTIVVSADKTRALEAFEFGVIDYVPKPFTQERLAQALRRVEDPAGRAVHPARRLAIRKSGRIEIIPVGEVVYIKGADKYSELILTDGRRELHDKTLSGLEAVLPPSFVRIHKSYLVRLSLITRLHAFEGSHYEAELRSGVRLPVSRAKYRDIKAQLA
jgi:DNA-binding LytR/AlgR family response regulator